MKMFNEHDNSHLIQQFLNETARLTHRSRASEGDMDGKETQSGYWAI